MPILDCRLPIVKNYKSKIANQIDNNMRSNSLAIHLKKSNKKTAAYCQRFSDTNPLLQLRQNFQQSENSVQNHLLFPPTSVTRSTPHWHIKALTPALAYQAYWIIDCASRIFYEFFFIFSQTPNPCLTGVYDVPQRCVPDRIDYIDK